MDSARIRVEMVLAERRLLRAYEILEVFVELVGVRARMLAGAVRLPPDMYDAVASLGYASPRVGGDIPEIPVLCKLLAAKLSPEFFTACAMESPEDVPKKVAQRLGNDQPRLWVNPKLIHALIIEQPAPGSRAEELRAIAADYEVTLSDTSDATLEPPSPSPIPLPAPWGSRDAANRTTTANGTLIVDGHRVVNGTVMETVDGIMVGEGSPVLTPLAVDGFEVVGTYELPPGVTLNPHHEVKVEYVGGGNGKDGGTSASASASASAMPTPTRTTSGPRGPPPPPFFPTTPTGQGGISIATQTSRGRKEREDDDDGDEEEEEVDFEAEAAAELAALRAREAEIAEMEAMEADLRARLTEKETEKGRVMSELDETLGEAKASGEGGEVDELAARLAALRKPYM